MWEILVESQIQVAASVASPEPDWPPGNCRPCYHRRLGMGMNVPRWLLWWGHPQKVCVCVLFSSAFLAGIDDGKKACRRCSVCFFFVYSSDLIFWHLGRSLSEYRWLRWDHAFVIPFGSLQQNAETSIPGSLKTRLIFVDCLILSHQWCIICLLSNMDGNIYQTSTELCEIYAFSD